MGSVEGFSSELVTVSASLGFSVGCSGTAETAESTSVEEGRTCSSFFSEEELMASSDFSSTTAGEELVGCSS